jgi:hypothetical protein
MTDFRAACMTDDERELWGCPTPPCVDCPIAFAADMRLVGRCNGSPRIALPAPLLPAGPKRLWIGGRGHGYATEAERLEARRRTWRESSRRRRLAVHNPVDGQQHASDNRDVTQPIIGGATVTLHAATSA